MRVCYGSSALSTEDPSVHALRLNGALPAGRCDTFECAVIAVRWIRSNEVLVYFAFVGRAVAGFNDALWWKGTLPD